MLGVLYGQIGVSPPPPPPPPSGFTDIAKLVVASAGPVELGVPMAQNLLTAVRSVRLNTSIVAQADNFHTDRSGWCRWFMLTTPSIAPGTYTLSGSTSIEAATTLVWSDVVPTSVSAGTALFHSTSASVMGYWRAGPCVVEALLTQDVTVGQRGLHARFLVTKYADGGSRTKFFIHNAYTSGGAGWNNALDPNAPEQLLFNLNANRGASQITYTSIIQAPYTAFKRTMGTATAHANLIPLTWSGSTNAGHAAYFCSSGMVQNYTGPFTSAITSVFFTSAGMYASPQTNDSYLPPQPFSKNIVYNGSVWLVPADPGNFDGNIGPFGCRNTGGGDDVDIGAHPSYYLQTLFNYDANHHQYIENTADRRLEIYSRYDHVSTKRWLRTDGIDYVHMTGQAVSTGQYIQGTQAALVLTDFVYTSTTVQMSSSVGGFTAAMVGMPIYFHSLDTYRIITSVVNTNTVWVQASVGTSSGGDLITVNYPLFQQYWEQAHWGSNFYLPYILTGQFEYFEGQVMQEFASWSWANVVIGATISDANHGAQRYGQYRHPFSLYWTQYYDTEIASGFPQERHMGWAVRTTNHTAAIMPDDEAKTSVLVGWDKSLVWTRWANVQQGLYDCYVVGSSVRFPTSVGARWTQNAYVGNSWMQGMIYISLGQGMSKELDVFTTAGNEYAKWLLAGQAELYSQTDYPVIREYLHGTANMRTTQDGQAINWNTSPTSAQPITAWVSAYIAIGSAGANNWPAVTTPNWSRPFIESTDWIGYRMDALVYAVQSSAHPAATPAYNFMVSMAQHYVSANYWYNRNHSLQIRT